MRIFIAVDMENHYGISRTSCSRSVLFFKQTFRILSMLSIFKTNSLCKVNESSSYSVHFIATF